MSFNSTQNYYAHMRARTMISSIERELAPLEVKMQSCDAGKYFARQFGDKSLEKSLFRRELKIQIQISNLLS